MKCIEGWLFAKPVPPLQRLRDNFYPDTLPLLEAAYEAWEVVMTSGTDFDQGANRNALAELIISFAAEGAPSRN